MLVTCIDDTVVSKPSKADRKLIVEKAIKNAAEVGWYNKNGKDNYNFVYETDENGEYIQDKSRNPIMVNIMKKAKLKAPIQSVLFPRKFDNILTTQSVVKYHKIA